MKKRVKGLKTAIFGSINPTISIRQLSSNHASLVMGEVFSSAAQNQRPIPDTWRNNASLARIIEELVLRDCEDERATGKPQVLEYEAYLNSTSQGSRLEDARKGVHIQRRSS